MKRFIQSTYARIVSFFLQPSHPVNLAIFRIVLFLTALRYYPKNLIAVSGLPAELRFPPPGYESFFSYIPINPEGAQIMLTLFICFSVLGLVGLYTRTSTALALLCGLYVFGVPQFFGKINHYHHLMWFLALLSVSRCGDVLSVDWLLFYRKYKPKPSVVYGLPLRLIWLTIGLLYFFPGFWKLKISGWAWALSDNLQYILYQKWYELGGFSPPFPLDAYPTLYKTAALLTILFEIGFLFFLFVPKLRRIAVFGGILFHAAIEAFMGIGFWELRWLYVVFFDWHGIFVYVRNRMQQIGVWAKKSLHQKQERPHFHPSITPVLLMGGFIVAECMYFGMYYIDTWPFGVYPSFARMAPKTATSIEVITQKNDRATALDPNQFAQLFGDASRWTVMQKRILHSSTRTRNELCAALALSITENFPGMAHGSPIQFVAVTRTIDPHRQQEPPLAEEVVCEA